MATDDRALNVYGGSPIHGCRHKLFDINTKKGLMLQGKLRWFANANAEEPAAREHYTFLHMQVKGLPVCASLITFFVLFAETAIKLAMSPVDHMTN